MNIIKTGQINILTICKSCNTASSSGVLFEFELSVAFVGEILIVGLRGSYSSVSGFNVGVGFGWLVGIGVVVGIFETSL